MSHETLGIGLAGLGRHGIRYAQHLLAGDVPGARLVAVHRRRHDEGRAWAGVRGLVYHDSLDALAGDPAVDLVVAALPPSRHPGAVEAAAAANKAVLVEKPLAATAAEAERAVEAARRAGIPAMVANTLRYNSVIRALAAALPRVGELHLVAINQRLERTGRALARRAGRRRPGAQHRRARDRRAALSHRRPRSPRRRPSAAACTTASRTTCSRRRSG